MRHERVRRLFLNVARSSPSDKIGVELKSAITGAISEWLRQKETRDWVLKNLYPAFVSHMKDLKTEEGIRGWATSRIGDIARISPDPENKNQAKKSIIEMYFSDGVNVESELGKELRQQLVWLTSRSIFEEVKAKAKSENQKVKVKAEILLKDMKKYIISRSEIEEV
jgi:hypothetical protein